MRTTVAGRLTRAVCVLAVAAAFVPILPAAAASIVPVYRFYNAKSATHFYTASEAESGMVQAKYPNIFAYEGIAYWVFSDALGLEPAAVDPWATPLHRFFNKMNGSHFYTISETEKAYVQANYAAIYTYEGVAYTVFNTQFDAPVLPVHRFYNKSNGSHFYTISDTEKVYVRMYYAQDYKYEGVAFYAIPTDMWIR